MYVSKHKAAQNGPPYALGPPSLYHTQMRSAISVSYAIISRHGGSLTCPSQLGVGTDLMIRLPVS
jgi:hypothetical protein